MTAVVPEVTRPVLTFDEAPHIYRVDGREVPSVTQVLKEAYGDLLWPWASEFAMERGRLVHAALHLWAQRDLDVKSLSAYIAGYVSAGVRWLADSGFEIRASENRMYSTIYDYAGTADLIGVLDRKSACVDYKTGEPGWATGPQTWAYAQAWQEQTGEVIRNRYGLRLFEDGHYQLIPYHADRDDKADFLAARRVVARRRLLAA